MNQTKDMDFREASERQHRRQDSQAFDLRYPNVDD